MSTTIQAETFAALPDSDSQLSPKLDGVPGQSLGMKTMWQLDKGFYLATIAWIISTLLLTFYVIFPSWIASSQGPSLTSACKLAYMR